MVPKCQKKNPTVDQNLKMFENNIKRWEMAKSGQKKINVQEYARMAPLKALLRICPKIWSLAKKKNAKENAKKSPNYAFHVPPLVHGLPLLLRRLNHKERAQL